MNGEAWIQALERVREMEAHYDFLRQWAGRSPDDPQTAAMLRQSRAVLEAYLSGGQWLADYTLDESGAFPPELKRGVLSQDGLYDLLQDMP